MNPILTALESGEQLTTAALMARFGVRSNVAAYMRVLMAQAPGIKCDYVKRCRELRWWMPDRQPKTDHQLKVAGCK